MKANYVQTLKPKNYLVSYMENGERKKFLVTALRKPDAVFQAELNGAREDREKTVQVLNNII